MRFLRSNKLEQLEFKLEKNVGFVNTQEKLENTFFFSEFHARQKFKLSKMQFTKLDGKMNTFCLR